MSRHYDYDDDAGIIGLVLICAGLIGFAALAFAYMMY